jgi:acyl-[acyl-carrier-protein]-phospholipid O-acyltransferase/long-chain-fatty-acid--[acyl-carrier-protein] ligase
MKQILRWLLRLLYRFEAFNEETANAPGPVLLLPNHVSWWDWILIGVCLEDDWKFVTSSVVANSSWLHRKIMANRRTFPIDVNSAYAVKHMAEYLQAGGRLVLFPEGRISWTGSLMKLFDGTGFLIHRTRAKVITAHIRGATILPFSRGPDRKRLFPKLTVHFSGLQQPPEVGHVSAGKARRKLTLWARDRMVLQQFETEMAFGQSTLPSAILDAARERPGAAILQDASMECLTYRKLLAGATLLSRQWARLCSGNRVGVLLPNVNAMPVTLLSLWAAGKVPAIFNYTAGTAAMLTCARVAQVREIITSKAFLSKAGLDVSGFHSAGVNLVFLEDVRPRISGLQRLAAIARQRLRPDLRMAPGVTVLGAEQQAAVILFTSGSEGEPKAVELSHSNLLANIRQMLAIIDINSTDRFFNALPLFHSFGLSVGMLMPLVRGIYTFLYLSPLHYKVVPSVLYDLRCTVFFGTNTFLTGYARKAHPYDFHTVRYLYAGAEKLQESTTDLWMRKFGVRIIEGYGATECSPCVSANTIMEPRHGSAGRLLPGIERRIESIEGVAEGGRLYVRGPNIMRGYLNPEPNAKFQALGGWYDTGDIVRVDEEGYLHIMGRLKRFAKVSGEMVSLAAVEDALSGAFPQFGLRFACSVVTLPDEFKGEKLILVSNDERLTIDQVRAALRAKGLSNLTVPREIRHIHEIPRLGTGKVNHRELEKIVRDNPKP